MRICGICFDDKEDDDVLCPAPCGGGDVVYHERCLARWLESHMRCPHCNRADILPAALARVLRAWLRHRRARRPVFFMRAHSGGLLHGGAERRAELDAAHSVVSTLRAHCAGVGVLVARTSPSTLRFTVGPRRVTLQRTAETGPGGSVRCDGFALSCSRERNEKKKKALLMQR
jgi:hypothetical protein